MPGRMRPLPRLPEPSRRGTMRTVPACWAGESPLAAHPMKHIETLLRRKIGLDANAVGLADIERVVRRRMQALNLSRPRDYALVLESSPREWESFLESVVVCETWFFRERAAFRTFASLVQNHWLPQHPHEPLRVLSAACASGEEPYSIAMALLDAGLPGERFRVDGVDVSAKALERAARGVYGKNSFRGRDQQYRQRYFRRTPEGFELSAMVRQRVRFQQANILSEDFLTGEEPYDFVFCRNVLIYFDGETRAKTLERLRRLIAPGGALFVAAAELPVAAAHGFAPMPPPFGLACRPARPSGANAPVAVALPNEALAGPPAANLAAASPDAERGAAGEPHAAHRAQANGGSADLTLGDSDLDVARQLADGGRLDDALAVCQRQMQRDGPSAPAFHLLGLVYDARGETTRAIECYRKALYLTPGHLESLLHLALLLERCGDEAGARRFRLRAERLRTRQPVDA